MSTEEQENRTSQERECSDAFAGLRDAPAEGGEARHDRIVRSSRAIAGGRDLSVFMIVRFFTVVLALTSILFAIFAPKVIDSTQAKEPGDKEPS